jgi:hypothetical protein
MGMLYPPRTRPIVIPKYVASVVQVCVVCQQVKPDRSRYLGLLQPLHVPDSTWSMVSLLFRLC